VTLDEFLVDLERRAKDAEVWNATAPVADVLREVAQELQQLDGIRNESEDRGLTPEQLATLMGVTRGYVYQHAADFAAFRIPLDGPVRYSRRGYLRWCQRRRAA
jgi:hypothetical protein